MREQVEFTSAGLAVRGWLERPRPAVPAPVVVLTHGFGGLKEWLAPVALPDPETAAFLAGQAAATPAFRNEITLASLDLLLELAPHAFASGISPRSLLMTVAAQDCLCPADLAIATFGLAREPKELHLVPGGHHAPYQDQFRQVMTRQIEFLTTHL